MRKTKEGKLQDESYIAMSKKQYRSNLLTILIIGVAIACFIITFIASIVLF